MTLYFLTRGPHGETASWPDGGALLDQPVLLQQAFNIIGATVAAYNKGRNK